MDCEKRGSRKKKVKFETDPHAHTRAAAEVTLSRITNFEELNGKNEQAGDDRFVEKTRELWKEIAVHGFVKKNEKTGENVITNYSDLDGKTALYVLKLAGIDTSDVKYLPSSSWEEGYINIDTGDRSGVVSEQGGKTAFFDHHGIIAETATSAAQLVYETVVKLGLLRRSQPLDKMIQFVTQIDNKQFPEEEKYYAISDRTMLGLQNFVQPNNLLQFFEDGKDVTGRLTDDDMVKYGLKYKTAAGREVDRGAEMRRRLDKSREEFKKAQIIETPKYGKVIIDEGKKIPLGFNTALANGCDGYVNWSPDKNEFKIYTKADLPDNFLPQGQLIRGKMWIKPGHDDEGLRVTLDDVINALKR